MADHFIDEEIERVIGKIESLWAALKLTLEEDRWARELGEELYELATPAYTNSDGIDRMRAIATAAAAVGHALIAAEAWATKFDKDFPR